VDNTEELPTVLSFCSGYAGIERGLDLAGIRHRVIAYVEIEAFAIANLVSKMESGQLDPAPIYTDLKTFPSELFRDAVDILTGGYPCQPFSAAGKRLGEKDPRHLWPYIREHIYTIQPSRVFLENVEGHISMGLSTVISDLEEDGYGATWGVFSAREVGAPHQRKRVYIMADSISLRHRWGNSDGCEDKRQKVLSGEQGRSEVGSEVEGRSKCGGELADTDSSRQQQGNQKDAGQSSKQFDSGGFQQGGISNSNIEGLQRGLQGGGSNEERWEKQEVRCPTECCDWRSWYGRSAWPPEPGVGRVVDGCADRVDRIRLLGNGVVPQTAAKAWQVLSSRLEGL
jgi:DNA (cytosine-5)-methyltransferase 1